MDRPAERVETRVETKEDGTSRFVERRTWPGPDDRSDELELRFSRPIRDDETCEQAAADSIAFQNDHPEQRGPYTHMRIVGPPGLGGFSAYSRDFSDGSSSYASFARPDLVRPQRGADDAPVAYGCTRDEPLQHQKGREQARWRRKDKRIGRRRRRGRGDRNEEGG